MGNFTTQEDDYRTQMFMNNMILHTDEPTIIDPDDPRNLIGLTLDQANKEIQSTIITHNCIRITQVIKYACNVQSDWLSVNIDDKTGKITSINKY